MLPNVIQNEKARNNDNFGSTCCDVRIGGSDEYVRLSQRHSSQQGGIITPCSQQIIYVSLSLRCCDQGPLALTASIFNVALQFWRCRLRRVQSEAIQLKKEVKLPPSLQ